MRNIIGNNKHKKLSGRSSTQNQTNINSDKKSTIPSPIRQRPSSHTISPSKTLSTTVISILNATTASKSTIQQMSQKPKKSSKTKKIQNQGRSRIRSFITRSQLRYKSREKARAEKIKKAMKHRVYCFKDGFLTYENKKTDAKLMKKIDQSFRQCFSNKIRIAGKENTRLLRFNRKSYKKQTEVPNKALISPVETSLRDLRSIGLSRRELVFSTLYGIKGNFSRKGEDGGLRPRSCSIDRYNYRDDASLDLIEEEVERKRHSVSLRGRGRGGRFSPTAAGGSIRGSVRPYSAISADRAGVKEVQLSLFKARRKKVMELTGKKRSTRRKNTFIVG